ncbi:taste receptor type 2 member 14-like [Sciurus carolinensis]|uniref:taste receptor type 2 member 14-like n=1 Tax=Sciurus carolinensis TaxID=30640 RepID=UPI001FB4FD38|nr:taste receptor type 2 member 14-like [Sciurus carolinensis]
MSGVIQNTFTAILSVEFITGNLGNGFIALVNCMDWVKKRKLSLVDQILTALALSRIGVLWLVLLNWWFSVLHPAQSWTGKMVKMIYITWIIISHFSVWLTTSLCIFYFLKIANFSNSIFLYLKWRIKKVVSVTLLMSLLLLFLNVVLMNSLIDVWIDRYKGNMTCHSSLRNLAVFSKLLLFTNSMFIFIPFTVSVTTFLLLIFSLWKHLKRMQHNARGPRDASTTAHVKALQIAIAFLLLYTTFFLSYLVQIWSSGFLDKSLILLFCQTAGTAFPSCHSYVLILGNNKLKKASLSVLRWLRCRFKDVEPLGS